MITLQASLYAVAITACLFFLCIAPDRSDSSGRTQRFLLVYVALESAGFALEWLMLHPSSPGKSLWLALLMGASFLVAPCLWLFARELRSAAPKWRDIRWPHYAIIVVGISLTLPLMLRAYWGPEFGDPGDLPTPAHRVLIQGTMTACAVLFLAQVPWYLRRCLRIHADPALTPRSRAALGWLVAALATNWVVSFLRIVHCMLLGKDTGWGIVFALLEVGVSVAVVFALARAPTDVGAKYTRSSLDAATRQRIRRKLDSLAAQGLHMDSALTLRALCQHLRENAHYVSQVINQDLRTTFNDLVNRHRIESAMRALTERPDRIVLEVALEVGFNSKSTFNRAFREHAGRTPTDWRRNRNEVRSSV